MLQRTFKNMLAHSSESLCQWESCVYPWWMLLSCHSYSGIPIQCNSEHAIPYFYSFFGIYIYVCFQFNTIVNMQYLYYTILSVYLNIYTYIHTYIYIYIMNLNNIPMLHFVFQPLLQRQFSACHERHWGCKVTWAPTLSSRYLSRTGRNRQHAVRVCGADITL